MEEEDSAVDEVVASIPVVGETAAGLIIGGVVGAMFVVTDGTSGTDKTVVDVSVTVGHKR